MKIHVDFYGHRVNLELEEIADGLEPDASDQAIKDAVLDDIHQTMMNEFPSWYSNDLDSAYAKVRELLEERKKDEGQ